MKKSMKEEWRSVKGYKYYEISNLGRLRSKDRTVRKNRSYLKKGRLLNPTKDKNGYFTFDLKEDGDHKNVKIHRLVAEAFIPNPHNKPFINHIDNNPSNNRVDNLEWATPKENSEHMSKQGRNKRTKEWLQNLEESAKAYRKAIKATNIKTGEILIFEGVKKVRDFGFQPSCVSNCCTGKRREHKGYKWEFVTEGVKNGKKI